MSLFVPLSGNSIKIRAQGRLYLPGSQVPEDALRPGQADRLLKEGALVLVLDQAPPAPLETEKPAKRGPGRPKKEKGPEAPPASSPIDDEDDGYDPDAGGGCAESL